MAVLLLRYWPSGRSDWWDGTWNEKRRAKKEKTKKEEATNYHQKNARLFLGRPAPSSRITDSLLFLILGSERACSEHSVIILNCIIYNRYKFQEKEGEEVLPYNSVFKPLPAVTTQPNGHEWKCKLTTLTWRKKKKKWKKKEKAKGTAYNIAGHPCRCINIYIYKIYNNQ